MTWISNGEKFVLLGLNIEIDPSKKELSLPQGYSVFNNSFQFPEHWKEWLGSQRIEDVESCTSYLCIKKVAAQPHVLDYDSAQLRDLIGHWYWGILLTEKYVNMDEPFIIGGAKENNEIDVRQFEVFERTGRGVFEFFPNLSDANFEEGAVLGETLKNVADQGGAINWRLLRCLAIYQEARCKNDILDRIHQFVRCIEGLIVSSPGKGKKDFKKRTELFIGKQHNDFMSDLYDLRGHIEHLHENRHLEKFDRCTRLEIAKKEAISEFIARTCLVRILHSSVLREYFGNVDALQSFWSLEEDQRRILWGAPINPVSILDHVNIDEVSDRDLGK